MNQYDYSTLNDKEAEEFVCDLLNAQFKMKLQSFKSGKDKGIDLRYATNSHKNSIIVQVKHYKSDFRTLFRNLKKEELAKVRKLKPEEYWLVTTLPLSSSNKDHILDLFTGFIPNTNYILGREDLNRILSKHKKIERNWLKLWLTNTSVLQQIVNNATLSRSCWYQSKIINTIRLYIKNHSLTEAGNILKRNKFLLITGQPGVGKTTLADILTYEFLAQGFQLVYIDKDVKEAEAIFESNNDQQQIFYFDDFLGANHLEILNPKSSESAIVNFIERVQSSSNKYLIMTTRTTILNDARESYEKLKRAKIDMDRKELQLQDFSVLDKAKILYSHLYHSPIDKKFKDEIVRNRNYWKIVNHSNYTPRLIEFICAPFNLTKIDPKDFLAFVLQTLDFPNEIWEHSFTKQIHQEDRFLLGSLYCFSDNKSFNQFGYSAEMRYECVEVAFNARLNFEIKYNGYKRETDSFQNSLKRLLDGYLTSYIPNDSANSMLRFINPSIGDFLRNYFINSNEEKWKLVKGAAYISQLKFCFHRLFVFTSERSDTYEMETIQFLDFLESKNFDFLPILHLDKDNGITAETAFRCEIIEMLHLLRFPEKINARIDTLITKYFQELDLENIDIECYQILFSLLTDVIDLDGFKLYVEFNWDRIMMKLWPHVHVTDVGDEFGQIFSEFDRDIRKFAKQSFAKTMIYETLNDRANDETQSLIYDWEDKITKLGEVAILKREIRKRRNEIFAPFDFEDKYYDESLFFRSFDAEHHIRINKSLKKDKISLSTVSDEKRSIIEVTKLVDDMFSSNA